MAEIKINPYATFLVFTTRKLPIRKNPAIIIPPNQIALCSDNPLIAMPSSELKIVNF